MRQLDEENARLKRVVADLTLDKHILMETIRKKPVTPTRRRARAVWMLETFQIAVCRACRLAGYSRAAWYKPRRTKDQSALRLRIRELAMARPRFGYQRIHILLRREGWHVNKKRVRRLYRLDGRQLRMRVRRRKHMALERVGAATGFPASITVDHGTEFMSKALEAWAFHRGVQLDFTRPGKPTDNSHIESFNGRLRDECLNVHPFLSLADAQTKLDAWRHDYNDRRPHGSLGHLTPNEFILRSQDPRAADTAVSQL
jgi:putative transposase